MFYNQTKSGLQPVSAKRNYSVDGNRNTGSNSFFDRQFRHEIGTTVFHGQAFSGSKSPQISSTKQDHLRFFNETSW